MQNSSEEKETSAKQLPYSKQNRDLNRFQYMRLAGIITAVALTLAAMLIFKALQK